ncbi:MAG TPA: ankyrin [Desulfobulbaceae bacterium]|nr:ankyrin [Desulfobulbaceae bacterium]
MSQDQKKVCPTCNGAKEIAGSCECSSEWRGSQVGEEWQDCQCTPTIPCPTCNGTGFVKADASLPA